MTTTLRYRSNVSVEDLAIGDCTMHRATNGDARWWLLWSHVNREDNGQPADFAVPMNPNGDFVEAGAGGKTWGLRPTGLGLPYSAWQVSPSINVLAGSAELHPGDHPAPSQWHQTPMIVDVPPDEPWITGAP